MSALEKLGEAARRARAYISPWNVFSPTDVASNLPGGGLASAAPFYGEGLKKTAEATKAFREGRFGDAARYYGSGVLDTATAGLSAAGDVAPWAKMAMAFSPRFLHATHADFDNFSLKKSGSGANAGAKGERAVFLTNNPEVADGYLGGNWVNMESPNIKTGDAAPLPNNPQVGRHYADGANMRPVAVDKFEDFDVWDMGGGGYRPEDIKQALKEARAEGAPGVLFKNMKDPGIMTLGSGKVSDVMAVLDPRLIYSDFDPKVQAARQADAQPSGAMRKLEGIRAFHGSPHDFDRFDMSKIGTGEGAQAYGHGLYFAEAEDVARGYRDRIAGADWVDKRGVPQQSNNIMEDVVAQLRKDGMGLIDAEEAASFWSMVARDGDKAENLPGYASIKKVLDEKGIRLREKGKMYEVRINADPEQFLDWDKPLSEQSAFVQEALKRGPGEPTWRGEKEVFDRFPSDMERFAGYRGSEAYTRTAGDQFGQDMASGAFKQAGIPGIKYLDAGSRGAGDGTRNYVVFDDKLIEIIRKYGWAPGMAIPAAMALEMQQAQEQSAPQM